MGDEEEFGGSTPFRPQVKSLKVDANAPFFPPADDLTGCAKIRLQVWRTFEDPDVARFALYTNLYILALILISAVAVVVETVPGIHKNTLVFWFSLEAFFVVNFSLEFLLRFWATDNRCEFLRGGMNWVDFISIAPFYVELVFSAAGAGSDLKFLRILRLGRALRLVKLVRYSSGMQMITHCLSESYDALSLFAFIFVALFMVCSSGIYYTERGTYDANNCITSVPNRGPDCYYRTNPISKVTEISPFQSVPDSIWWCIVTLTTVGYGDAFPITYFGQLIAFITQMLGVLCLALPLSIIGSNFHEIRQALKDLEKELNAEEEPEVVPEQIVGSNGVTYTVQDPSDAVDNIKTVYDETEQMENIHNCMCQAIIYILEMETFPKAECDGEVPTMGTPVLTPSQPENGAVPVENGAADTAQTGDDDGVELALVELETALGISGDTGGEPAPEAKVELETNQAFVSNAACSLSVKEEHLDLLKGDIDKALRLTLKLRSFLL